MRSAGTAVAAERCGCAGHVLLLWSGGVCNTAALMQRGALIRGVMSLYVLLCVSALRRELGPWCDEPVRLALRFCPAQGIETVRRDNCLLVKNMVTTCLELILIDRNVQGAVVYVKVCAACRAPWCTSRCVRHKRWLLQLHLC